MIKTQTTYTFNDSITKHINAAMTEGRIYTSVNMPLDPKPYDVWQFINPLTNSPVGVRIYLPFHEIIKGLCNFNQKLVDAMPNTLCWYTAGLKSDTKFYRDAIPNFDKNFVPNRRHVLKLLNLISKPVIEGAGRGYYGFGEAGIGKTSTALWLFAVTNTAIIHMNCKRDMVSEEFFVFQNAKEGVWVQSHGSVLQAVENNWPIVIDELDLAPDSFWPSINNLIEGRKFAVPGLDDLQIQAGSNFRLIGFGNTGPGRDVGKYKGRSAIDSSFFDRMIKDYYDPLTKEEFHNILKSHYEKIIDDDLLLRLSSFAFALNTSALNGSFNEMLSPRSLLAICQDFLDYTGVCVNPLMTAIGNTLGSVLRDKRYTEQMLNTYAATICSNALEISEISSIWDNRDNTPLDLNTPTSDNSKEPVQITDEEVA